MIFKNPKGQIVGSTNKEYYITERDIRKGQMFTRKHIFNNKHFNTAIGIQKEILDKCLLIGIKVIRVFIINELGKRYQADTPIKEIYEKGVLEKEDRENSNITKWGYQYIWDVAGRIVEQNQRRL